MIGLVNLRGWGLLVGHIWNGVHLERELLERGNGTPERERDTLERERDNGGTSWNEGTGHWNGNGNEEIWNEDSVIVDM